MDMSDDFDFGLSTASSSLRTDNDIWADVKRVCRELNMSKKTRKAAIVSFSEMIASSKHKRVIHESGTWGFVLNTLLEVIEEDYSLSLKKKKSSGKITHVLEYDTVLLNVLDYAHEDVSPSSNTAVLDRDSTGKGTLKQLVSFCERLISNPNLLNSPAESSCYRLLDKVLKFEAYCRITDENCLKKILECALSTLQARNSSCVLVASRISLSLLSNLKSDLHSRLPGLMEFFHDWFQDNRVDDEDQRKQKSFGKSTTLETSGSVARNLLNSMVVIMTKYAPSIAPLLHDRAQEAVLYVQRNLREDVVVLASEPVEFLIIYYRLVFHRECPPTSTQCRELKHLYTLCILDDKILAAIVRQSANMQLTNTRTIAALNEKACLWLSMIADVLFYHDQWSEGVGQQSMKRARQMTGFDTILSHLEMNTTTSAKSSVGSQAPSTQMSTELAIPLLRWLLLLQSLLARHGRWYAEEQSDRLESLRSVLISLLGDSSLDSECKQQTLQCLLILALRAQGLHSSGWQPLWQILLSDYSFRNMTKSESGDVVLQLFSTLIIRQYIVVDTLEKDFASILELPVFANHSVLSMLILYLIKSIVDFDVCNNWSHQEIATFYFTALRKVIYTESMGFAIPLMVSAISSLFSDGPSTLDCTPYLLPALWKGFATCDITDEIEAISIMKHDTKLFDVPKSSRLSRLVMHLRSAFDENNNCDETDRVSFPKYVNKYICLDPVAHFADRLVYIGWSVGSIPTAVKDQNVIYDEIQGVLSDMMDKADSSPSDQYLVHIEALLNIGVVLAAIYDKCSFDINVLMKNLLSTVCSRIHKWQNSPPAFLLLQKLFSLLQLLGRNSSSGPDGVVKYPASCRAILGFIAVKVHELVLSQGEIDRSHQKDDDDMDLDYTTSGKISRFSLKLWCLRIYQLLQNEAKRQVKNQGNDNQDISALIRQVVGQQYIPAIEAMKLVPSLCHPLTVESFSVIIYLLENTLTSYTFETCEQIRNLAYEIKRQNFDKPEILSDIGVIFDRLLEKKKPGFKLRGCILSAYEQLFLLDADRFSNFNDFMMKHLVDIDIRVQVVSLGTLQSPYMKYFEGTEDIYNDVSNFLKNHDCSLFVSILASYVSAASADVLLSRVLALYSTWHDAHPDLLRACVDGLCLKYGFSSSLKMLEDQLWTTICHYIDLTQQLSYTSDLLDFPVCLFDQTKSKLRETPLVISIVPLLMLLDQTNNHIKLTKGLNILDTAVWIPTINVTIEWASRKAISASITQDMASFALTCMLNLNCYGGLLKTLYTLGLMHLLEVYTSWNENTQVSKYQFKSAWNLNQWNLKLSATTTKYDGLLYGIMKSMVTDDEKQFLHLLQQAKRNILLNQNLSFTGLETTKATHKAMLHLETLAKLEEVWNIKMEQAQPSVLGSSIHDCDTQRNHLTEKWIKRHKAYEEDFETLRQMLNVEERCLKILDWTSCLPTWYLTLAKAARKAQRSAIAFTALENLNSIVLEKSDHVLYLMEKAKLYFSIGEPSRALLIAKESHKRLTDEGREGLELAKVSSTIGKWLAHMKAERSEIIQKNYLEVATRMFDNMNINSQFGNEAANAYRTLANYMFESYNQVKTRVESNEWKRGKRVAEAQEAELKLFEATAGSQKTHSRHGILRKQVEYDKRERNLVESSVERFLSSALKNYGLSLRHAPSVDMTPVFRILSLWFRHFQNTQVNMELDEIVKSVPSFKFIPLSYQIMSRLGTTSNTNLRELVRKMTIEHPHHTIVQLLALKNGSKRGTAQYRDNVGLQKSEEAINILKLVKKENQLLLELVENMEVLCDAYITLALFDTKEFERRGVKKIALSVVPVGRDKIPFDNCLRLRKFNQTIAARPAVLTYTIKPRSDCDYSNVPRVQSFDKDFTITDSGVHKPKIIYCYGSDGIRRKQLVKGNDDTRQDLVIEQAFDIINSFLAENPNTQRRHLQIKTYKVTPLDTVAGVLEWVDNTMPMGGYLNGKPFDAHMRYHPHEWKHSQCRSHLQRAVDKYRAYMEIQSNFSPVFHHFFLEKYPDPATWYSRREAYTRSVAVTSIVGHILGIGDRHSQNILIDEASGELVHIDFGVVFDQGMTLITPETVPFRLTRDIVDGMGVNGVDGVFTRCCEETLKVLRKRGNALATIVEVFIHDPLYNWTLSPGRALQVQQEKSEDMHALLSETEDENVADLAARVLLRVKQKLQGYEDPTGEAMSVEGQVKHLIQVARDPHNLCKIYPGWGPWL
ncbi:hypothetical protein AeRB84_020022 [Aphanomyces euteiches]|nr:hypothetical protein AeRB84_020022 [Aphanomyces euteiches]